MDANELFKKDAHELAAAAADNLNKKEEINQDNIKQNNSSPELRTVKDNLKFIKKLEEKPIPKDVYSKIVFGVKLLDPRPVVFGNNIWNRSIWVTDELNDLYTAGTYESMAKYFKKKRKVPGNMLFLLILLGGGGIVIFIVLLLMGVFG